MPVQIMRYGMVVLHAKKHKKRLFVIAEPGIYKFTQPI